MASEYPKSKIKLQPSYLRRFADLWRYLEKVLKDDYGFESALLFLFHPEKKTLELVSSQKEISFSLDNNPSLLVQSFIDATVLVGHHPDQVFEDQNRQSNQQVSESNYIILPLLLTNQSIGVFVLSTFQKELSDLEKQFLLDFSRSVALPIFTTWNKEVSEVLNEKLKQMNYDYRGLIEVKQAFLEQVESLLIDYLQHGNFNEKARVELISCLSYLQSFSLLSSSTLSSSIYSSSQDKLKK